MRLLTNLVPDPSILLEGAQDSVLPGGWLAVERAGSPTRIVAGVVSVAQLRIPAIPVQDAPPVTIPATLVTLDTAWYDSTTPPTEAQYAEFTVWAAGEDVVLADEPWWTTSPGTGSSWTACTRVCGPGGGWWSPASNDVPGDWRQGSELTMPLSSRR
jgi:hypothetical protein